MLLITCGDVAIASNVACNTGITCCLVILVSFVICSYISVVSLSMYCVNVLVIVLICCAFIPVFCEIEFTISSLVIAACTTSLTMVAEDLVETLPLIDITRTTGVVVGASLDTAAGSEATVRMCWACSFVILFVVACCLTREDEEI